jgi:hypothetical protein
MSDAVIRGKQSHTENSEEISYSPSSGWSKSIGIDGPKLAVRALLNQLAGLGYAFTYKSDQGPKAAITVQTVGVASAGETENPTLAWEYFAGVAEIDVLEADIANVNSITSTADKKILRDAINGTVPEDSGLTGNANTLFELIKGGLRNFRVNIPTLRVSKLVSGGYPVKASLTNVGRIITTNTLTIQENIPGTLLFNLPSYTSSKSGYVYAWYKKFPNVQQSGGNRWNVSQEWEYGLWTTFMYGSAL